MSKSEIRRLQKELDQERSEKEQERRKNQKTTLKEYLYNCHFHLYRKLSLADASYSLIGTTRVDGKYYPKWLWPWREFENTHRQRHFDVIKRAYRGRHLFHQESTTRNIGLTVFRRRAGDENAIEHFEKLAVEDLV